MAQYWFNGLEYSGLEGGNAVWFNGLVFGPLNEDSRGLAIADSTAIAIAGIDFVGTAIADSTALGVGVPTTAAVSPGGFTFAQTNPSIASFNARRAPAIRVQHRMNGTPDNSMYDSPDPILGGQNVTVDFGDGNGVHFAGIALRVTKQYDQEYDPLHNDPVYSTELVDYSWLLNRRRPLACYYRLSATTVVLDLVARFSTGFTTTQVETGLAPVTVTFTGDKTFTECLVEIAQLIGARYRLDGKDLLFKVAEDTTQPDDINDSNLAMERDPIPSLIEDISQIRNRVWARGAQLTAGYDTSPGQNYMWVEGIDVFTKTDGSGFRISLGGGEMISDCVHFTYKNSETVYVPVNRGLPPVYDIALSPSMIANGQIKNAVHYKIAYLRDTTGESGLSTEYTGPLHTSYRTMAPGFTGNPTDGGFCTGNVPAGVKNYLIGWRLTDGTIVNDITVGNALKQIDSLGSTIFGVGSLPTTPISANGISPDLRVIAKVLLRTKIADLNTYYEVVDISLAQTSYTDVLSDDSLGDKQPSINYGGIAILLYNLPVEDRKGLQIYRSDFINGVWTPYALLVTLGDNTTTTFLDTIGLVNVGAPPGPPAPLVKTRLAGIPTSGYGSITEKIKQGSPVYLYAMQEDTAAQAYLAAREGGDGIHEHEVTGQTSLLTYDSLNARLKAELSVFAYPIITFTYATTDRKTKVGRKVNINLTHPPVGPITLRIQQVDVDRLHESLLVNEKYRVTTSSVLYTVDDLLRRMAKR